MEALKWSEEKLAMNRSQLITCVQMQMRCSFALYLCFCFKNERLHFSVCFRSWCDFRNFFLHFCSHLKAFVSAVSHDFCDIVLGFLIGLRLRNRKFMFLMMLLSSPFCRDRSVVCVSAPCEGRAQWIWYSTCSPGRLLRGRELRRHRVIGHKPSHAPVSQ